MGAAMMNKTKMIKIKKHVRLKYLRLRRGTKRGTVRLKSKLGLRNWKPLWSLTKAMVLGNCLIILITFWLALEDNTQAEVPETKQNVFVRKEYFASEENPDEVVVNNLEPPKNVISKINVGIKVKPNKTIANNSSVLPGGSNVMQTNNTLQSPVYVMVYPNESPTFSSETTATVQKINFKEGEDFQTGNILIQLDCRVQQADLNKALAQQKLAASAYKSAEKLNSYGAISETEMIKAQSEAEISNAEVDKLSTIVDKCTIKAPFKGAVSDLYVHFGETIKPGDPLIKIVSSQSLELHMQVPSVWLKWLHVGSPFSFHVNELNISYQGKITRINPEINPVSQTIKIVGVPTNTKNKLLPGMSGQATFPEVISPNAVVSHFNHDEYGEAT